MKKLGVAAAMATVPSIPGPVVYPHHRSGTLHLIRPRSTSKLEAGKKALQGGGYEKAIRAYTKAEELSGDSSATASLGLGTALWRKYRAIQR